MDIVNPDYPDYSIGLMQINIRGELAKTRPLEADLKIPEKNIDFAYKLYKNRGNFDDWKTCSEWHWKF